MRPRYLIFGLQRSGTKFLATTLKENYGARGMNVEMGRQFWKHRIARISTPPGAPVLVIYKHPLLWIESIAGRDPHDFFRTQPGSFRVDSRFSLNGYSVTALAAVWAEWFIEWVQSPPYPDLAVSHHRLLSPEGMAAWGAKLERKTGWTLRTGSACRRPDRLIRQSPNYDPARDDPYYRCEAPLRFLDKRQAHAALLTVYRVTGRRFPMIPVQ